MLASYYYSLSVRLYMTENEICEQASQLKRPECRTDGAPWNSFHCGVSRDWIGHSYIAVALFPASGWGLGMRLTWLHWDITTSHFIIPSFCRIVMHYTLHFHDHHYSPVERMEDHCNQSSPLPLAIPDSNIRTTTEDYWKGVIKEYARSLYF